MSAVPDTSLGRRTIGEILLEHGFVTKEQVDEATALQAQSGRPLGQILVESGTITRLELASALAEQWSDSGAPIAPPAGIELSGTAPEGAEAAEPSARPFVPAPQGSGSELLSRVEAVESELDKLREVEVEVARLSAAEEIDRVAPLRSAVEELAERLSATEPAMEEIGRRLEFLVVERGDGDRLEEIAATVAELQERLAALSQRVETAAERSQDAAAKATTAFESLSDQVAALSARLSDTPNGADVEQLRALVEALSQRPARDPDLVAQIEDLQAVVEALGERPARDPDLAAQIEDLQAVVASLDQRPNRDQELIAQVDTLAMRFVELGDRVDVLAAGVQSFSGDADALHELEGALAELTQRPLADPSVERRVDELAAALEALSNRPDSDPAIGERLDALAAAVDELAQRPVADPEAERRAEELAGALEELRAGVEAIAERPAGDPALDEKLWDIAARLEALERGDVLEELRARLVELGERPPVDPAVIQRFTEIERRLDEVPGDDVLERLDSDGRSLGFRIDGVIARLDEMATSAEEASEGHVSREAWEEARALIASRFEVEAELNARLEELEERIATISASGNGATPDTVVAVPDPELESKIDFAGPAHGPARGGCRERRAGPGHRRGRRRGRATCCCGDRSLGDARARRRARADGDRASLRSSRRPRARAHRADGSRRHRRPGPRALGSRRGSRDVRRWRRRCRRRRRRRRGDALRAPSPHAAPRGCRGCSEERSRARHRPAREGSGCDRLAPAAARVGQERRSAGRIASRLA